MSKELENLKKLMSFAFVMSENMVGLSKGDYDERYFIKKTYEYLHKYNVDFESRRELERALQRLEAIDNANPSEALDYMKSLFECWKYSVEKDNLETKEIELEKYIFKENYDTIKQALLKAQEQEKVLKVIFEKPKQSEAAIVYIRATIRPSYEDYCLVIRDEYHLTEEEFDLLNKISKDIRGE